MTEKLSLTELQQIIKDSLYIALPDLYWVVAEISEMKENYAGHCYLELIEKQPDEINVRARVKAIIWSNRYRFLKSFFESITGESLQEGMKVLVRTKVEYHELYGLSLVISDIDPSFTFGEMALKRQMIIKRLEEDGVFSMNKEISLPMFPQKIAVISSKNAAGYSDFINHLKKNSYGYVFHTALFETVMQGIETEQSVINALDNIAEFQGLFDVAVIIRGGGSQTDLSWFDNYNIAYHVTQFPIPVLTGIGHEKDLSVTDMVAFQALKTPTAVADFIIESVAEAENHINEMSSEIVESSRIILEDNRNMIESYRMNLIPVARLMLSDQKEMLSVRIIEMINFGKDYILRAGLLPANQKSRLISATGTMSLARKSEIERSRIDLMNFTLNMLEKIKTSTSGLLNTLKILDPENVLKRGYTITIKNGEIIKSINQLTEEEVIDTQFSDGRARSKVIERQKTKDKR
ncbi:MAG: exodeoxyribonuclease VII large subunit [Bacteroidia bacterium]|nr:exodeoxyribonuclease VII large subunit [Bacteroidia bacterium]